MNKDTLDLLKRKYDFIKAQDCVNIAVLYALKHDREFKDFLELSYYIKHFHKYFLSYYFDCSTKRFAILIDDWILAQFAKIQNSKASVIHEYNEYLLYAIKHNKNRDLSYDKRATQILFDELFEANNIEQRESLEHLYDIIIVRDEINLIESQIYEIIKK